jgi:hypothetical protein
MSAIWVGAVQSHVRFWQILLQKSVDAGGEQ